MESIVRYTAQDGQEVELTPRDVLSYIVSGNAQPSDKEILSFMAKCQARGLNPLAGDAYMVTFQDRVNGGTSTSVIVSKDYFVRTATQQESFDGMEAGIITSCDGQVNYHIGSFHAPNESLIGGWARVHVKNWKVPVEAQVMLNEYSTGKKMWRSKPATMIRKVALVQALREAFPVAFSGVYEREEMGETGEVEPPYVEPTVEEYEESSDPSEPVNAVTQQQMQEIDELLERLAQARGVAPTTAKAALYATGVMHRAGVSSESDLMTERQAAVAIGQLNAWLEASRKEADEFEGGDDA